MEMSTYNLSADPEWLVTSRKAAYCARRLNGGADNVTAQDMEDMIQAAALAYWKHHREGCPVPFCFVCARQAVENYFYHRILGRYRRNPFSLDAPLYDGGDLPQEWLATPAAGDDARCIDWLSDEVLEGVLFEARQAAGFSQRQMTRYSDTIQTDKRIIRLAANGHTNASIAELMGTTEGTIRNRRQRIRRLLEDPLAPGPSLVEYVVC
jgi:DNA-binding CsgD family transcriptional regulator